MPQLRLTITVNMDMQADVYTPAPQFANLPIEEAMLRTEQVELLEGGTEYIAMILDGWEHEASIELVEVS